MWVWGERTGQLAARAGPGQDTRIPSYPSCQRPLSRHSSYALQVHTENTVTVYHHHQPEVQRPHRTCNLYLAVHAFILVIP